MRLWILAGMMLIGWGPDSYRDQAQTIVGTWQLTDEKTCFQGQMEKSETEKELEKDMGSSRNAVARLIRFDKKGSGEEGIFSTGKKKAAGMSAFNYKVNGPELLLMDIKSGIMTQQFIIDTLTQSNLTIHLLKKDCEIKTFTRIK